MNAKKLNLALSFASRGWRLFPQGQNKRPLIKEWPTVASADEAQIQKWVKQFPNCNFAVTLGQASGVLGVDVDVKNNQPGMQSWEKLRKEFNIPDTLSQCTPSNGRHFFYHWPEALNGQKATVVLEGFEGVEFKMTRSAMTLPGSHYSSGADYLLLDDLPLADLPEALVKLLQKRDSVRKPPKKGKAIPEHQRNDTLTSIAGGLRLTGMDEAGILATLLAENASRCQPPLPENEVRGIAASVASYPAPDRLLTFRRSETGNANRLVYLYGNNIRFCDAWGWLVWDGIRWKRDASKIILLLGRKMIEKTYRVGMDLDELSRADWMKFVAKHDQAYRIKAAIELASCDPGIVTETSEYDTQPMLCNALNGTIDLETGRLEEAKRENLMTKCLGTAYEPDAECPQWIAFLQEIMAGRLELVGFLQAAIGYSLTGLTKEQCWFLLHGRGRNGKSTMLRVLSALFGDYAVNARTETLLSKNTTGGANNDIAALSGSRLVTAIETEANRTLNEGLVKQLSGEDSVTARFLYHEHFSFLPAFKLFLAVNHLPRVRDASLAMWRRVRLLPFDVVIPEEKQDKDLTDKLLEELPGILAWAVRGTQMWLEDGLVAPEAVKDATKEYQDTEDVLRDFLDDCCTVDPSAETVFSEIYHKYKAWAEENGHKAFSATRLGFLLEERGYPRGRIGNQRSRLGIAIAE